jgi:hypothetical protein
MRLAPVKRPEGRRFSSMDISAPTWEKPRTRTSSIEERGSKHVQNQFGSFWQKEPQAFEGIATDY